MKVCISQHERQRYVAVLTETAIIVGTRLVGVPAGFSSLPLMDCQLGGSEQNRRWSIKLGSRGAENGAPGAALVAAQHPEGFPAEIPCVLVAVGSARDPPARDPPRGLEGSQLPQEPVSAGGRAKLMPWLQMLFSLDRLACQGMVIAECFATMQLKGKLFLPAQAQGYRYRVFLQGMFWTEILSEYRLPELSSAQALEFFESAEFFCPVQLRMEQHKQMVPYVNQGCCNAKSCSMQGGEELTSNGS